MSEVIDNLVERSVGALIHDALSSLPTHVYEAATGIKISKLKAGAVAVESSGTVQVSERPLVPGENDENFLPLTLNFGGGYFTDLGQLQRIRDVGRLLYFGNEICSNAIKNRTNFVVGEGLTYRLLPKNISTSPKALVAYALKEGEDTKITTMMANWSLFCTKNKFNHRLRDWNKRAHREGEAILRLFNTKIVPSIRFIYPDYLEAQDEDSPLGIKYDSNDSETPVEFYVRYPAQANTKTIKANEVIYDKRNVDMENWRGLPTGYAVFTNLRRIDKLLINVSVLAQIQSAIALIRKHENATGAQVSKFLDKTVPDTGYDKTNGTSFRKKSLRAGTVLDAPKGTSYDMPAHAINTLNFIQVIDKELAHVAAAYLVPIDWLLTTENPEPMNPGSPAYQSILAERADLFMHVEDIFWRVQEMMGLNSEKLREKYELCIEGPDIPVAKAVDQARIDQTYQQVGATSPQEIAQRKGWNYIVNRIETIRHRATAQEGEQMPGDAGNTNTGGGDGQTDKKGKLKENNAPGGNTKV